MALAQRVRSRDPPGDERSALARREGLAGQLAPRALSGRGGHGRGGSTAARAARMPQASRKRQGHLKRRWAES